MSDNKNLSKAKKAKDDEFYTLEDSIADELQYYKPQLFGKHILCNCNDLAHDGFYRHLVKNFHEYQLLSVTATSYDPDGNGFAETYNGTTTRRTMLQGDGSYSSPECERLLEECDIVITNPPFSIAGDFIDYVLKHGKQLLVICPLNKATNTNVFPYFMANRLWFGVTQVKSFKTETKGNRKFGNVYWFTNIGNHMHIKHIVLKENYDPDRHPHYDDFDGIIHVDKMKNAPADYDGTMAFPVSYLPNHSFTQFDLVGTIGAGGWFNVGKAKINGKEMYKRVLVRKRK